MWTYVQRSGQLYRDGELVAGGYSGFGSGKNAPDKDDIHDVGPIPDGVYRIGEAHSTSTHGPLVLGLEPDSSNEMYGRSGFLIHGDSVDHPGLASRGCIIMPKEAREAVNKSGDRLLTVVAEVEDV